MNINLWKRVYCIAPDDPKAGLRLLKKMDKVEQALKASQPEGVELVEFTDGALYFAGFIAHVAGGTDDQVRRWLQSVIR